MYYTTTMRTLIALSSICIAALIFGCKSESSEYTEDSYGKNTAVEDMPGAVVDTANLFRNPGNYEGRVIKFYASKVYANPDPGLIIEGKEGRFLASGDERIPMDPPLSILITPNTKEKWIKANFLPKTTYTVTFSGLVRRISIPELKRDHYIFDISSFVVNWEEIPRYNQSNRIKNNLPTEILSTPLPQAEFDLKKLALFPEKYKDRRIKIQITFRKDKIQNQSSNYSKIESDELEILISKQLMSQVYDSVEEINLVWLVGRVEPSKNVAGKTLFIVSNIYLLNK